MPLRVRHARNTSRCSQWRHAGSRMRSRRPALNEEVTGLEVEQVSNLDLLRAKGIGRDFENEQMLFVSFNRRPTDDEMRVIHDLLRDMAEDVPATSRASGDAYMIRRHHPTSEVREPTETWAKAARITAAHQPDHLIDSIREKLEEPTDEMVEAACAAFDKAARAEGWKCDDKRKATFSQWMRAALAAALEERGTWDSHPTEEMVEAAKDAANAASLNEMHEYCTFVMARAALVAALGARGTAVQPNNPKAHHP